MEGLADIARCPVCGYKSIWFVRLGEKQALCVNSIEVCRVLRFTPDGKIKSIPTSQSEWERWEQTRP